MSAPQYVTYDLWLAGKTNRSSWQMIIKRTIDIIIAIVGIVLTLPLFLYAAFRIMLSSKGPIIYKQERIGWRGKPFMIYKLRSMYLDAEDNGPLLASQQDARITPWGKIMRKWRIDELPQFINVLKGEMSLVGPRPERKYYIDQIIEQHPQYLQLLTVTPGLTSWGMIKFGYAENITEMVDRMQYDLNYLEQISFMFDLKILFYTFRILLNGKGK